MDSILSHRNLKGTSPIRILIADDHSVVRTGIRGFISGEKDMAVVAEAETGNAVIDLVRREKIDVVLLDIEMPKKNGIDTLRVIRQMHPLLAVLVLSSYPEEYYAVNMLRAGANGYIAKNANPNEMLRAIRLVAAGHRYLSEAAADLISAALTQSPDKKPHEKLSNREFQIFLKIAGGQLAKAIGDELNLSVKTVSTYRSRILNKMNLKNNAELTHYAINNSLIS